MTDPISCRETVGSKLVAEVAAFNQEKALVGAFSVITNLRMGLFEALLGTVFSGQHKHSRANEQLMPGARCGVT